MAAMKPEHLPSLWGTVYMHKEVLTTLFCKVIKLENTQVFTFLAGHMAHVCNPSTGRPKREGCEFKIYKRRLSRVHAHQTLALDLHTLAAIDTKNNTEEVVVVFFFFNNAETLQEIVLSIHRAVSTQDVELKHKTRNLDRKYPPEEGEQGKSQKEREELRLALKAVNYRHLSSENLTSGDLIAGVFTLSKTSPKASVTCRPVLAGTSLHSTCLCVFTLT